MSTFAQAWLIWMIFQTAGTLAIFWRVTGTEGRKAEALELAGAQGDA